MQMPPPRPMRRRHHGLIGRDHGVDAEVAFGGGVFVAGEHVAQLAPGKINAA